MKKLPEFRVTLTRLKEGEHAYPKGPKIPHHEYQGQKTKLGGEPDWIQEVEVPCCDHCKQEMMFVAQIDSLEHNSKSNPNRIEKRNDRAWMLGDVGMIYVFFCFRCCSTKSVFQCG
jgi:hypothetical protein